MLIPDEILNMNPNEVIKELQEYGIQVVIKPVALLPDTLESYHGIGRQSVGTIDTDIYEALRKARNRKVSFPDPFS